MRATIELTYLQAPAPCEVLDEATATETDDRVIITVIVASQPDDEQCPGAPVSHVTRVALDRPVGGRQVVDSTSGAEIPWARSQSQQLVQPLPPGFIATLDPPPMSPIAAREPVPDPLPSEEWALGREGERQVWVIDDDQLTGAVSVVDFAIPWERAIAGHSITTLGGVDAVIDEGRAVVVLRRDQGVRRVLGGEDGVPSGEPALLDAAIEVASALGDGPLDAPLPTGRLRSAIVATATSPVVTYGHTIEIQIVRFERRPTTDELRWSAARFARVNDATTFADQAYVVDMPSDRQMLVELVSPVDAVLLHTPGDADLHTLRPALQLSSLADSGLHIAAGPTSTENVAHGESEWGRWSIAHSEDRMCQKATVAEWTVGGLVPTISSSFDCVDAHPRSAATCQFLDPFRAVVVVVGLDSSTVTVSSDGLPIAATFEDGDGGVAALVTGLRADASLSIDADGTTIDC